MKTFKFFNLYQEILSLTQLNLDHEIIGTSFLGEPIYCFHLGKHTGKQLLIEGGIHAREYISSLAVIKELKHLYHKSQHLDFGVYFIPLVNPDGARLVLENTNFLSSPHLKEYLLHLNHQNPDFSLWKANIIGVDLNVNFDAMWGLGKSNVFSPTSANFVGFYPNSESETKALINFMSSHNISGTLSIHTKGEVVYYGYPNLSKPELQRDFFIAESLAKHLSFSPEKTIASVGGFSDYVSEVYHIPALTIELGHDNLSHPIGVEHLETITKPFVGITQEFAKYI